MALCARTFRRREQCTMRSTSFHWIPACASSVVELWFAVADLPKGAVGAHVVAKAAFAALLLNLQLAVRQESHRDFAVACAFRHEHGDSRSRSLLRQRVANVGCQTRGR